MDCFERMFGRSMAIFMMILSPAIGMAQNGPGGIGNQSGDSELALWLRADQAVNLSRNCFAIDDGEPVNRWKDLGGNGFFMNQPNKKHRPQWLEEGLNGQPAIQFTRGDQDFLKGSNFRGLEKKNEYTIFLVTQTPKREGQVLLSGVKATEGKRGKTGLYIARPKNNFHPNNQGNSNYRFTHRSPFRLSQKSGTNTYSIGRNQEEQSGPDVLSLVRVGKGEQYLKINNEKVPQKDIGNGANKPFSEPLDLTIGTLADWMNSMNMHGKVGEVIVYNRALNKAEVRVVEEYLRHRYRTAGLANKKEKLKGLTGLGMKDGQSREKLQTGGLELKNLDYFKDSLDSYVFSGYRSVDNTQNLLSKVNFGQVSRNAWRLDFQPKGEHDQEGDVLFQYAYEASGQNPGSGENYRLIFKKNGGEKVEVLEVQPEIVGQIMEFQVDALKLKTMLSNESGYFHLGTRNPDKAPLPDNVNPGKVNLEFDQAFTQPD